MSLTAPPPPHLPKLPPTEPAPDECCANDCRDCVWTDYSAALDEWRRVVGAEAGAVGAPAVSGRGVASPAPLNTDGGPAAGAGSGVATKDNSS